MKKIMKTMIGVIGVSAAGLTAYTLMNKRLRKKTMDLKDAMIEEAHELIKK